MKLASRTILIAATPAPCSARGRAGRPSGNARQGLPSTAE